MTFVLIRFWGQAVRMGKATRLGGFCEVGAEGLEPTTSRM